MSSLSPYATPAMLPIPFTGAPVPSTRRARRHIVPLRSWLVPVLILALLLSSLLFDPMHSSPSLRSSHSGLGPFAPSFSFNCPGVATPCP